MAKKKIPNDARYQTRKRYFADCPKCTASFEADRYEDTQEKCSCGVVLTWNDKQQLKSLRGKR